jgi:exodeoxyribonuclease V alpha subunit
MLNQGIMPDLSNPQGSDFFFIAAETPEEGLEKIQTIVQTRLPKKFGFDPVKDIQVLCPMARGKIGARALNAALQAVINPNPTASIVLFGTQFAVGDKVIQTTNDYDKQVYNGDIGIITAIDVEEEQLTITFEDRAILYEYSDMDDVSLAYAITIHKSQGSEYPAVVIPFTMQSYMMLQRNLLYTAVTRGKKIVVLVGEKKAIRIAVQHRGQLKRYTKLRDWLMDYCSKGL